MQATQRYLDTVQLITQDQIVSFVIPFYLSYLFILSVTENN
jgi:hypothetical protein